MQVLFAQYSLGEHLLRHPPRCFGALLWVEVMKRIRAPLPLKPFAARVRRVQIVFDFEAHVARKLLRAFADNQVMISLLANCLGNQ